MVLALGPGVLPTGSVPAAPVPQPATSTASMTGTGAPSRRRVAARVTSSDTEHAGHLVQVRLPSAGVTRWVTRCALAVVVAVLAVLGAAPGAWARTDLTTSEPVDGASVGVAPERITLTFDEPVDPDLAVIFVTGADGLPWPAGEITAAGNALTMAVTPSGPAGPCIVRYNIASDHPISGEVRFTLTEPAPSRAPTTTERAPNPVAEPAGSGGSGGVPLWLWLLLGAVLVGVVVGVVVARLAGPRTPRT